MSTYAVVEALIEALEKVRDISEGARHYRDADGSDGLMNAMGDIDRIVNDTIGSKGPAPVDWKTCVECGEKVKLLSRTRGLIYDTHDAPKPCRQVCPGSGQLAGKPKPRSKVRR